MYFPRKYIHFQNLKFLVSEEKDDPSKIGHSTETSDNAKQKDADKFRPKLVQKTLSGRELFKLVQKDAAPKVEKSAESSTITPQIVHSASQHEHSSPALTTTTTYSNPQENSSNRETGPKSPDKSPDETPPVKSNSLNNPDSLWDIHSGKGTYINDVTHLGGG